MFHIVLVAPEIPPNTGNVIRLAANTGPRPRSSINRIRCAWRAPSAIRR
jgi:tRNA(Leu) C34 or U34 (ribose-2'-O)-methylase TrmL